MNRSGSDSSTLVIFCRRPVRGTGKRRIAADLGCDTAQALGVRLLATVLEDAASWPGPVVLAPADAADRRWATTLLDRPAQVIPQPQGNLGERINGVDKMIRSRDDEAFIYVGSDAPVLDPAYYAGARRLLNETDVVLGPAEDGGVTLMGARSAWPDLRALPWSTAGLAEALERICLANSLNVKHLKTTYDIDLARDLPRLHEDLAADPRPARQRLRRWLAQQGLNSKT